MKRASDYWIQLKGKPALSPSSILSVDIITKLENPDDPKPWSFNVILITGDHFIFEFETENQAKNGRQTVLLKTARYFRSE